MANVLEFMDCLISTFLACLPLFNVSIIFSDMGATSEMITVIFYFCITILIGTTQNLSFTPNKK